MLFSPLYSREAYIDWHNKYDFIFATHQPLRLWLVPIEPSFDRPWAAGTASRLSTLSGSTSKHGHGKKQIGLFNKIGF